jgi:ethanolamine utilization protein EutN
MAIDSAGADVGERVLVVIEGRAAGEAIRRKTAPVDAAIVGIVDWVDAAVDEARAPGRLGAV